MKSVSMTVFGCVFSSLAFAEEATNTAMDRLGLRGGSGLEDVLVPIAFFVFVICVVAIIHVFRIEKSKEVQITIRAMVEKGVPVPPELLIEPTRKNGPERDLRKGLMLVLVGIAFMVAMFISQPGERNWIWGIVPLAMGIARIASSKLSKRES